ncbi:hypothetical protein SAY86_029758 [Trapa natans]|uniref:Nucleoprotein TPR/MLP1 domain-containing protein n=1 Tax=Trapa natans TaxID=22666 RepID=A0AAN7RC76_TRANT|nr:hypothetical protein SAY86_029758 [Trapa natans]
MPLFLSDDEFARCSGDAAFVAEKADDFIRKLFRELETVKAESDASSITAEQTCSLLEQKYQSLSSEFYEVQSKCAQLQSSIDQRLSELADVQAQKHQLHLKSIEKDAEVERLVIEVSELHKSKRQLIELVERKDLELSEKNATIKSYLDKIISLTDVASEREVRLNDIEAELTRNRALCSRMSQEKELIERHNLWLNDELKIKVDSLIELRRAHADLDADLSSKLSDAERRFSEISTSLKLKEERVRELETRLTSLQEEFSSSKDAAAANDERFTAEISTVHKLVDLYKQSSEEWSGKARELEGVIKALETHLTQVENDYKDKLDKELSMRRQAEKEAEDLKVKLEKCEAELEPLRKENESNLFPLSNFSTERLMLSSELNEIAEANSVIIPKVPAGVSGTALAASLLRDGWSLTKMYVKYQEAVDALKHEQLGRKEAEAVLQRVLYELEEKAEIILDERAEHERMAEAYSLMNQKLQQSISEQSNLEKTIQILKADIKRRERDYMSVQKEVDDLQQQITVLLKECRDIQLRCGSDVRDNDYVEPMNVDFESDRDVDKVISQRLLTFKDIKGLVEQNVQLRSLVRSFSDQIADKEMEFKDKLDLEIKKNTEEGALRVASLLQRAEELTQMTESLNASVAMYKRLYEEEYKRHISHSPAAVAVTEGRADFKLLIEGSQEAAKRAQELAADRVRSLEEELDKSRARIISLQSERDKLALEADFVREKVDALMKESESKRHELDGVLSRNVEFTQLIVDYQRKIRDNTESLHTAEEISRKLTMEVSILKHEKELLANAEKRACDEVKNLSDRVHRLQATLDTLQSTDEVRQEARAAEKRKQEEYIKQIEREWAEAKNELQEERHNSRNITLDRDQTLKSALKQVEDLGKQLADALHAVAVAESKAAVAEARFSDMEKQIRSSGLKVGGYEGTTFISTNEVVAEVQISKEDIDKLKEEAKTNKEHMLQYKSIAQVNETALKQMEHAHENFKAEAERLKISLEAEVLSLRERVCQLETEVTLKSKDVASSIAAREEALALSSAEITKLKEESVAKASEVGSLETKISLLEDKWKSEHERWRSAHANYERQVILQSETIQELTRTSEVLALLQEETSGLRKSADMLKRENDELKSRWSTDKSLLEESRNVAEKKYSELNEQNKILHDRLEALHIQLAERDRSGGNIDSPDSSLQNVINYLRRTKEIAETEISLLKQEKLRLQSQLESALKAAETAQASLHAELASSKAVMFTEEEFKSLQIQVREMNLLRESNSQLREENKHNFEECQRLRDEAQKFRIEYDNLEKLLREKQVEVETCKKEIEWQKGEKAQLEKRVSELVQKCGNIDIENYEHMKIEFSQIQEKLKENEVQIEELKVLASQKQDTVSLIEQTLQNCRSELNEKEDKHRKIAFQLKRRADNLAKEKEELNKENQVLLKQLEDLKQGKRPTADVSVEQLMKEKEEKDTRIQMLEKTIEKQRDILKKEKERRQKSEDIIADSFKRADEEKSKVINELEKHKLALKQVSGEVEKIKQAEDNLPEITSAAEILTGNTLDDHVSGYFSAMENFERVAQSVSGDPGALAQATTGIPVTSSISLPPKPAVEERDKKLLLPKPSSDTRKNVRRLVRPRLKPEDVQQQDTEMPGVENTGKQLISSQQGPAAEGAVEGSSVQQPPRKRQLAPSAASFVDQSADDGESALKRSKGLDLSQQEDPSEGGQAVEPPEEALDTQPPVVDKNKDSGGDLQMEDTEISSENVEEDQKKEQNHSGGIDEENLDPAGSGQGDMMSGTVPNSDVVLMVEDQQMVDESDKEEGELASDIADPEEGGSGAGDVSPEAGMEGEKPEEAAATTPTASPIRGGEDVDAVFEEMDNSSSLEAPLPDDEKGEEEGEIPDEMVADADVSKIESEQQQVSSETAAGASSVLPTPSIRRSPSPSSGVSPSPGLSPSLTTVGSSSTTINLRERAREKAALRQAGTLPSTTPSRGRAVRGRAVRGRIGRTARGGAQPPGESGQGSR